MSRRYYFAIGSLVILLGLGGVRAQEGSAPTLKSPASNGHWILDFAAPKPVEGAPPNAYPVSMDISNSEGLRLFKTKFSDGKEETAYVFGGGRLIQRSGQPEIRVLDRLERSALQYDAPLNTYPGFDWISPAYFKGEADFSGRVCYRYARELPPMISSPDRPGDDLARSRQGMVTDAYVDKATLLPVAYVDGGVVISYRFAGVSAPFTLPDEFRKAMRRQAGYRTE
jgi:hypothetical protein